MQMACMARDLMTPLESTRKTLSQIAAAADGADSACRPTSTHIQSALASLSIMDKICTETIDNFRTDLTDITNEKRSSDSTGRGEGLLPMPSIDEEDGVPQDLTRSSSAASFSSLLSGGAPSSSRHRTVVLADFVDTLRTAAAQACASEGTSPPPIEIVPDPTVPGEFLSDDLKLFRSALHLLTNAARHTPAASSAVAPSYIRLRIYVKKTGHGKSMLMFECRDTGTGVDSEQRQKLYSPFFMDLNHKNTALANHDRPGLGLYSVAINVSSLGGRYGYRPRDRESWDATAAQDKPTGSIFWFAVPLFVSYSVEEELSTADMAAKEGAPPSPKTTRGEKRKMISVQDSDKYDAKEVFDAVSRAMEDSTAAATRAPSLAPAWGMGLGEERLVPIGGPESGSDSGKRALVIDDSIVIRKSIGKALTNLGFHITYASDGMQGLQALQSAKFDVVFCDFLMPVLDGLDCIEQYRSWEIKHRPDFHQKIVGLSAHAGEEDISRGKKAGMDTFVSKDSKLKDMLNRAIALSETFSSGEPGRSGGSSLGGATNSSSSPAQSAAAASSSAVPPSPLDTPMNRLATHPAYSSLMLRRSGLAGAEGVGVGLGKSAGAANSVSALNAATNSTGGGCPIGAAATLLERRRRSSAAAEEEEEEATPGLECLICEDSRSAARALAGALTAAGWTPHLADDAEHALAMLKTKRWGAAFIEEGGGGADSGDGGGGDGEEEEEELQKLPPGSGRQLLSAFRRWEASHRTVRQSNLFAVTCRSSSNSPVTNGGDTCTGSSCPSGFDGAVSRPIEEDVVVSLLRRASARRGDREEITGN